MTYYPSHNSFVGIKEGFTFDDLLLRPAYSNIRSRKDTDISQNILGMNLKTPIIPANMSTVTGPEMVGATCALGGTAAIHRFLEPEEYVKQYSSLPLLCQKQVGISLGLNSEWNNAVLDKISRMSSDFWPSYAIIDIAHGHHQRVVDTVVLLRQDYPGMFDVVSGVKIIVGNICTEEAVLFFLTREQENPEATVHGFKVGVGPGSVCTTRQVTGCGFPQLSAVKAVSFAASPNKIVIADGGIRTSGDIVKALAAGAHLVMAGGVFAGTDETPGPKIVSSEDFKVISHGRYQGKMHKRYAGMASKEEHENFFGRHFHAPEGVEHTIECQGPVEDIFKRLNWGIRSGLSYCGCENLEELREYGDSPDNWIRVTPAGFHEGTAHFRR